MKKCTHLFLLLLVSAVAILPACRKEKDEELDTETASASDYFLLESQLSDELKEVDAAAALGGLGKAGPLVTIDTLVSPKTMTISYGSSMLCDDGKVRSGRLNVAWTGKYRATGTIITITADSFYQEQNRIEGMKTVKNRGLDANGNSQFAVSVTDARLTKPDGRSVTWSATRTRKWISGQQTPSWNDDVYLLTGSSAGKTANGLSYSAEITEPLRIELSCPYKLVSGKATLTPLGRRSRFVDYGSGTCDNRFTITIADRTYTIN